MALARSYLTYDQEVRNTGRPIINRHHEYTADRSNDHHLKSVFPLFDRDGALIGTTCIYYKRPAISGAPDWHGLLKPVTEYINAHYAEDIPLEHLAAMVGTSVSNFRRQFAHTLGISPGRYLTIIRLNAARRLLETTDMLFSEIATETGFFDQSHFTKMFKHERGITPGEYRRRHRIQMEA